LSFRRKLFGGLLIVCIKEWFKPGCRAEKSLSLTATVINTNNGGKKGKLENIKSLLFAEQAFYTSKRKT
jgi:hypothetical protein